MARKRPKKGFKEQARTHSKTTPRRRIDPPGGANEWRGASLLDLSSLTQLTAGTDFSSAIDPKASPFVSARPRVVLPKAKVTRHFLFLPDRPTRAPRPLVHSHQQEKHWNFSSTMDTNASLFATARPRAVLPKTETATKAKVKAKTEAKKGKKIIGFPSLPGEIRNRIYQYYFQDAYRCELVGEGCDFTVHTLATIKLQGAPQLKNWSRESNRPWLDKSKAEDALVLRFPRIRRSAYNQKRFRSSPYKGYKGWLNPHGALILVCKQVHTETLPLFYRQIEFVFEAPQRVSGFLRKVPKHNHVNITKIHLYYTTYGSPSAARDTVWQDKHIESWTRACKVVAKSLTCLQSLKINVWINENAPRFNLRQKWLQPLLQFRRLTCDRSHEGSSDPRSIGPQQHSLQKVFIEVKTRLFLHEFEGNVRVSKACRHLHQLFGLGISRAILGAKEDEAMTRFNQAWNEKYKIWQHHLGFARTGW